MFTRPLLTLLTTLFLTTLVSSTALTTKLSPNEKNCFYTWVPEKGAKVAFYFAVRYSHVPFYLQDLARRQSEVPDNVTPHERNTMSTAETVQSGGSFDVDYSVQGPNQKVIMDGQKERQGDFVFTANENGEYRFCFDNEMSTVSDKMVDFEITVENESRASLPSRQGAPPEQTSLLQESIYKLSSQLSTISRNQKYFRTRENRNFSTVRSTENRIFRFSVVENLVMVGMAGLQVFVVRFFFQGARKGV